MTFKLLKGVSFGRRLLLVLWAYPMPFILGHNLSPSNAGVRNFPLTLLANSFSAMVMLTVRQLCRYRPFHLACSTLSPCPSSPTIMSSTQIDEHYRSIGRSRDLWSAAVCRTTYTTLSSTTSLTNLRTFISASKREPSKQLIHVLLADPQVSSTENKVFSYDPNKIPIDPTRGPT